MRRYLLISLLFVAACGGAGTEDPTVTSQGDTTSTAGETTESTSVGTVDPSEATSTTEPVEDTTTTTSDLPVAPDFSLELGTGGEFQLSDTDNPVYLVFWAEW